MTRVSVKILPEQHKRLKMYAAYYGKDMQQLLDELLLKWILKQPTMLGLPKLTAKDDSHD